MQFETQEACAREKSPDRCGILSDSSSYEQHREVAKLYILLDTDHISVIFAFLEDRKISSASKGVL